MCVHLSEMNDAIDVWLDDGIDLYVGAFSLRSFSYDTQNEKRFKLDFFYHQLNLTNHPIRLVILSSCSCSELRVLSHIKLLLSIIIL